jgi:UDP-N-acetylmuramoyl-tripeptide--D-alanyl-D-alanine ligase
VIVAVVVIGIAGLGVSLAKWLRVSQREHYLPGSCGATAERWLHTRPVNQALAIVAVLAGLATLATRNGPEILPAALGSVTIIAAAVFPWGLPVLGTPRLKLTRRARTLAAASAAAVLAVVVLFTFLLGAPSAFVIASVAMVEVVDLVAAALVPLERRALERHRRTAAAKLERVAPTVIAVTGSWGKTTTKNHIRDLLASSGEVVASPASWNNTAGLSRTMNEHLTESTDVLVVEMGMYGPGEIRQLCSWVRPDIAVITAIGPMHLERVGTIEGIVAAKAEILERADAAVLWVDDPRLAALAGSVTVKLWRVGTRGGADLDVEVEIVDGEVIVWAGAEEIGRCGAGSGVHPGNVGCAVAAALAHGAPPRQLAARLPQLANPAHRATVATSEAGVLVIDDTFNSNPAGARAAVSTLAERVPGRRAVVTPGMVELGDVQDEENRTLAKAVVDSGATLVITGWTNRRSLLAGAGGDAVVVSDREAARHWVREHLGDGDGVLWENDLPDHYP